MSFHSQQKLPYVHLDRNRGLPSGQIHNIALTNDGEVWMSTPAGLSHYDGLRVTTYTQKEGLGTHGLRAVHTTISDELYIATDVGLDKRIDASYEFESVISADEWQYGFIECLLCNDDGSYWIGTANGLFRHTPKTNTKNASTQLYLDGFIQQLLFSNDGDIWVLGKPFGLAKLNHDSVPSDNTPYVHAQSDIETMCFDTRQGEYLLIGGKFGVKVIGQNGNSVAEMIPAIPDSIVTCLFQYKDEIWLGTSTDLYVFVAPRESNEYIAPKLKKVLEHVQVTDISADAIGNIWVASGKNGAYKFSFMRQMCVEYQHTELESVFSIRPNLVRTYKDHDYLLASKSGVFSYSKGKGVSRFKPLSGFKEHVWDLHENIDGQIWLASESGLYLFDKMHRIRKIGRDNPVCRAPNRCLLEAEDGGIYLGTQAGLALINTTGIISEIKDVNYSSVGYVYTLENAPNNHIYVGTIGNGAWYGSLLGLQRLTSKYINDHDSVYSISRHSNGELIFICNNKVIHKNRTGQERILLETEHMIAGWTARWDGEDRIWVGSSNGLYEIGVKAGVVLRQFKSLPGGSIWEFNFSESLRVGSQGEIFCGLRENFTLLDSKQLRAIRNKPVLALRKHTWVNADSFLVSEQHVNAGKWSLDFSFACNWAMDEENLLFRYRLVGFDETWSKLQKVENLHFTSLPIGEYSLLVQAYSPLFGWGDSAELFAFKVSPATRLDSLLTRTLGPVFKLKESAKGFWKNMGLQKMEDRVDALVQSKVSEVEQDKQELLRENRELSKFSNVDTLTGAANRRAFDDFLEQSIQQSMRHQLQLSLILLDIDYFKGYNDAYGHLAGDDALKKVSVIVQGLMRRAGDLFARYGGEEFAIVLPLTDTDSAQALAKRINKAIWSAMIEHLGQPKNKRLTCSMGVVSINFAESREAEARDLIHEADSNLYTAKHKGKNCFIASEVVF